MLYMRSCDISNFTSTPVLKSILQFASTYNNNCVSPYIQGVPYILSAGWRAVTQKRSLKVTGRAKIMHEHFLNCNVTWCFDFNFMVLIGKINSSQRKMA
eukprot:sb/3478578/